MQNERSIVSCLVWLYVGKEEVGGPSDIKPVVCDHWWTALPRCQGNVQHFFHHSKTVTLLRFFVSNFSFAKKQLKTTNRKTSYRSVTTNRKYDRFMVPTKRL
jgi:hypothetical protein